MVFSKLIFILFCFLSLNLSAQEFRLNVSNELIIQPNTPLDQAAFDRLTFLRTRVLSSNKFNPAMKIEARNALRKIQQLRRHNLEHESSQKLVEEIRQHLSVIQKQQPQVLFELMNKDRSLYTFSELKANDPCQAFQLLDREDRQSFYKINPDNQNCSLKLGVDQVTSLTDVTEVMLKLEDDSVAPIVADYRDRLKSLVLTELLNNSSNYRELNLNHAFELDLESQCRQPESPHTSQAIDDFNQQLQLKKEELQKVYSTAGVNRRDLFVKSHLKNALIAGVLAQLKEKSARNGHSYQVTAAQLETNVRNQCLDQIKQEYGFYFLDQPTGFNQLEVLCLDLINQNTYKNQNDCQRAYRATTNNPQLLQSQRECIENGIEREYQHERFAKEVDILPSLMARSQAYPLLFEINDDYNLTPLSESQSSIVASSFTNNVLRHKESQALKNLIEKTIFEADPDLSIEVVLARLEESEDFQRKVEQFTEKTQNDEKVIEDLSAQLKRFNQEQQDLINHVCENNGDFLHHFPGLHDKILEDIQNETKDSKKSIEATMAYCYLNNIQPADQTQGLPPSLSLALGAGLFGVSAVNPLVGAVGAIGLGVVDGLLRNDFADRYFQTTLAAQQAGWATSEQALLQSAKRADSRLTLAAEGLLIAGEVGALSRIFKTPIVRSAPEAIRVTPNERTIMTARLMSEDPTRFRQQLNDRVHSSKNNVVVVGDLHLNLNNPDNPSQKNFESFLRHLEEGQKKGHFSGEHARVIVMGDILDLPSMREVLKKDFVELQTIGPPYYVSSNRGVREEWKLDWDLVRDANPELWLRIREKLVDYQMEKLDKIAKAAGVSPDKIIVATGNHEMPSRRAVYVERDGQMVAIHKGELSDEVINAIEDPELKEQLQKVYLSELSDFQYNINRWRERFTPATESETGQSVLFLNAVNPDGSLERRNIEISHVRSVSGGNISNLDSQYGGASGVKDISDRQAAPLRSVDCILNADTHKAINIAGNNLLNNGQSSFCYSSTPALGGWNGNHVDEKTGVAVEDQGHGFNYLFLDTNESFTMTLKDGTPDWSVSEAHRPRVPAPRVQD